MGLLTFLLRLPWLPVQGFVKLASAIRDEAQREMASPATIRRELEHAERARASGEMSDEQVTEFQDAALAEFTQAQRGTAAPTHEGSLTGQNDERPAAAPAAGRGPAAGGQPTGTTRRSSTARRSSTRNQPARNQRFAARMSFPTRTNPIRGGDDIGDESRDVDEPEAAGEDRAAGNGRRRPARPGRPAMTAAEAARAARRQIAELTARQPEGITGMERTEDGWAVGVELVEDQRIPSSSDILTTCETTIGPDGELVSYRRIRRYPRGRGDTEET